MYPFKTCYILLQQDKSYQPLASLRVLRHKSSALVAHSQAPHSNYGLLCQHKTLSAHTATAAGVSCV